MLFSSCSIYGDCTVSIYGDCTVSIYGNCTVSIYGNCTVQYVGLDCDGFHSRLTVGCFNLEVSLLSIVKHCIPLLYTLRHQ